MNIIDVLNGKIRYVNQQIDTCTYYNAKAEELGYQIELKVLRDTKRLIEEMLVDDKKNAPYFSKDQLQSALNDWQPFYETYKVLEDNYNAK